MTAAAAYCDAHASPLDVTASNRARMQDILQVFAEVEGSDVRLAIVLAAARMDAGLRLMLIAHAGWCDVDIPCRFFHRLRAAHLAGLIDEDLREFMNGVRWLKNEIAHRATRADTLESERYAATVARVCELAGLGSSGGPGEAVARIPAAMLTGVLAAELSFVDDTGMMQPKSFAALRGYGLIKPSPQPRCKQPL